MGNGNRSSWMQRTGVIALVVMLLLEVLITPIQAMQPLSIPTATGKIITGSNVKNNSMPALGKAKALVFLVEFQDYRNTNKELTAQSVQQSFFGNQITKENPYGSLSAYYKKSSFGNLQISGTVYGWYTAQKKRSSYSSDAQTEELCMEILDYYQNQGINMAQYDANQDGVLDCVYLIFAGGSQGWGSQWWDYTYKFMDYTEYQVNQKKVGTYIKLSSANLATAIHETGHALGLFDYYSSDSGTGKTTYGIGGIDMMDGMVGDHNAFSKIALGWITPTVITPASAQNQSVTLDAGECAAVFLTDQIDFYGEYYLIEYLQPRGLNAVPAIKNQIPNGGIRILKVNGAANVEKAEKLLSVVEADRNASLGSRNNALLAQSDLYNGDVVAQLSGTGSTRWLYHVVLTKTQAQFSLTDLPIQSPPSDSDSSFPSSNMILKKGSAVLAIAKDEKGNVVSGDVIWEVVDNGVAEVDRGGKVTALKQGSSLLLAFDSNSKVVCAYLIQVINTLDTITIQSSAGLNLRLGQKTRFSIKIDGIVPQNLNVAWSCSNSARVQLERDGSAVAKKAGTVTVYAKLLDSGIVVSQKLTVYLEAPAVTVKQTKDGAAFLRWNPVKDASGYLVYRYNYKTKKEAVLVKVQRGNGTTVYRDKKVKRRVGYAYQVFAYDGTQGKKIYGKPSPWVNFRKK